MINFVREQLNLLKELTNRDEEIDKFIDDKMDIDSFGNNLFYTVSEKYTCSIVSCLSKLFKESDAVEDWIYYMLYETKDDSKDNVEHKDKSKHTINNVDSLCNYLEKFYKLRK